jgi:hypothetical protein
MGGHHRLGTKNQENIDRLTALCLAVRKNHRKVVKLLKEKNTTTVKNKLMFQAAGEGNQKKKKTHWNSEQTLM